MTRRSPRSPLRRLSGLPALLGALMLAGCASDDPMWDTLGGDWSVFEGIPGWFEEEFERSGRDLSDDAAWVASHFERNVETTADLPRRAVDYVEEDTTKGLAGLRWQGEVISRRFRENVESFEDDVLGAPDWVRRDFERAGEELGDDWEWITTKVEQQAERFWPEVRRYLRVLLR